MPIVQRRSKPVNGRVVALAVGVLVVVVSLVGAAVVVAGETSFFGVVVSLDGEVPDDGLVVVVGDVVVVVGDVVVVVVVVLVVVLGAPL
jgi:hypothetical protein